MTLPPTWTTPLFEPAVVREADRRAIEDEGIPGTTLMERAATALAEAVMRHAPDGPVAVIVGKGNNGGDGLAAARLLRESGRVVRIHAACASSDWTGDAEAMLDLLGGSGPEPLPGALGAEVACVVDCLLGTGATGSPRGAVLAGVKLIGEARAAGAVVVACDVPSGVDSATGEVPGEAVEADVTVTFHCAKPGLWINPGKGLSGRVEVADIGIPGDDGGWDIGLIGDSVAVGLPERAADSDKFSAGSVVVAGGSPGLTGAPVLAALGSARGGAGYVTVALPQGLLGASDTVPELMGLALPEERGSHCPAGAQELAARAGRIGAIVLGPGLGRSEAAIGFARCVAEAAHCPLVIDADAIHAFAGNPEVLASRRQPTILTPHGGEMASLLGIERGAVDTARLQAVRTAAARSGAVVVLKGDDTLVAGPSGEVAVSRGGAPALATAGSGDVLGGLAGALLARGVEPLRAAAAAVRIHVEAGRLAAVGAGEGTLATDIASALPRARALLATGSGGR